GQLVDGNTLFTSWSTTKGFAATCLHILADRGQLDYDTPVATYWPEFGVHGKDVITVREAITHRAGVPQMPEGVTPEMMGVTVIAADGKPHAVPVWRLWY